MVNFDAELWLSEGNSVDVIVDWVNRNGLPEPPQPRWTYEETLDRIANAYQTNFWHEGKGFGIIQRQENKITPNIPNFLKRYLQENRRSQLAKELKQKVEWSSDQIKSHNRDLIKEGERLLLEQKEDGSFVFNPDEIGKDDFKVGTTFIEPMGLRGETALDITIRPATRLLLIGKETRRRKIFECRKKGI